MQAINKTYTGMELQTTSPFRTCWVAHHPKWTWTWKRIHTLPMKHCVHMQDINKNQAMSHRPDSQPCRAIPWGTQEHLYLQISCWSVDQSEGRLSTLGSMGRGCAPHSMGPQTRTTRACGYIGVNKASGAASVIRG